MEDDPAGADLAVVNDCVARPAPNLDPAGAQVGKFAAFDDIVDAAGSEFDGVP